MLTSHHTNAHWSFTDRPSTAVYTSRDIIERKKSILFVSHDADDGSWHFLAEPTVSDRDARIVALDEIIHRDPTVIDQADLPRGWTAVRVSVETPWQRRPIAAAGCAINDVPHESATERTILSDCGSCLIKRRSLNAALMVE